MDMGFVDSHQWRQNDAADRSSPCIRGAQRLYERKMGIALVPAQFVKCGG